VDKLYDETSPAISAYPYGISKLQGEFGALQMADDKFSVISLRQGTVCGHSPRMRFDLIVNIMFKHALAMGEITVNNPSIWRPILSIKDAVKGYMPTENISNMIESIYSRLDEYGDLDTERFYNIRVFKRLENQQNICV